MVELFDALENRVPGALGVLGNVDPSLFVRISTYEVRKPNDPPERELYVKNGSGEAWIM